MNDTNYVSFNGPQDDGRIITADQWTNPSDPSKYDDIFKCSNVRGLVAQDLLIDGHNAREDAIDCVRGRDYVFVKCFFLGKTTIKGAIRGWLATGCRFSALIEIGQFDDYWYPGRPPTTDVRLTDCITNGVTVWDGDLPELKKTTAKITKIPKFIWYPYFLWRYWRNGNKARLAALAK